MLNLSDRAASTEATDILSLVGMNAELLREEGSPVFDNDFLEQRILGWITGEGFDKHEVRLIFLDGQLAGFFSYRIWPGEKLILFRQIYVIPQFRRQGIASWAVQRVKELNPDVRRLLTVVTKTNIPSQQLFNKLGGQTLSELFTLDVL